jgi:hypothetical protein
MAATALLLRLCAVVLEEVVLDVDVAVGEAEPPHRKVVCFSKAAVVVITRNPVLKVGVVEVEVAGRQAEAPRGRKVERKVKELHLTVAPSI